jgi:hypothetical protein
MRQTRIDWTGYKHLLMQQSVLSVSSWWPRPVFLEMDEGMTLW